MVRVRGWCAIPWMRTPRPMGLGRGWLRWCEFSSSAVGLRGLHGLQDAASFKMVVPRDRGSLVTTFSWPHARHFTKSQQYPKSHTRAYHHAAIFFLLAQHFPSIKILTLENDFHEEISSLSPTSRIIDRHARGRHRNVPI